MKINPLGHKVETHTTKAGFKIVNVHIEGYPVAVSSVWLNTGSSFDPLDKLGLAHFFEHLFLIKTTKNPDRQKRLEEIEKHGFIFDALTALEFQHYFYIHSPQESKFALDLLADGLINTLFDKEDVAREKEVVINEEKQNHNDPASYIWRLANRGLWGEKLLGKDFYGTSETIKDIKLDDLKNFYQKYCVPANLQFVFINSDLTQDQQDKTIDSLKLQISSIDSSVKSENYKATATPVVFESMTTENCQLSLTFLTDPVTDIKGKALQDFMVDYLASGWTSRLVQRMRIEENLVYWVYSDSSNLRNTGYIRFTLSTQAENVDKVLKIFKDEVKKLKNSVLPKETLEMHKTKFISDVLRNSTQYGWLMYWYGFTALINNRPFELYKYLNEINEIKPAVLQNFTGCYMTDERFTIAYIAADKIAFKSPTFR
jgi:predicted Zn-dependent peptidase